MNVKYLVEYGTEKESGRFGAEHWFLFKGKEKQTLTIFIPFEKGMRLTNFLKTLEKVINKGKSIK
jgi:hypothetical protein